MTIVAECRYALTGVGAAIAPGSQKCSGNWADLENAPTSTSARPTWPIVERGAASTTAAMPLEPAWWTRHSNPPSIASPPAPVTSRARSAPARAVASRSSRPIRRNDSTDVSSQQTNRVHTSPATTRPSIAPANNVKNAAKRVTRGEGTSSAK